MRRGTLAAMVLAVPLLVAGLVAQDSGLFGAGSGWEEAPTVTVTGERETSVQAYSWSGPGFVADGMPRRPLPDIGASNHARITMPGAGDWTVHASLTPLGQRCGRSFPAPVHDEGDHVVIQPAGPAGTYQVFISAEGQHRGLSASFRWTTTVAGPVPDSQAILSLLAGASESLASYGVELILSNLAMTPAQATARVTVTAANGATLTIPLQRQQGRCTTPGTIAFTASKAAGQQAASLGPAPFQYVIRLRMDGRTYRGTSTWPQDLIPDFRPYTRVAFTPDLPSYAPDPR